LAAAMMSATRQRRRLGRFWFASRHPARAVKRQIDAQIHRRKPFDSIDNADGRNGDGAISKITESSIGDPVDRGDDVVQIVHRLAIPMKTSVAMRRPVREDSSFS